ncbi:MAG: hypothetical protein IKW97_01190 [Muribaculaceae bacterium]|nr:hypothetical protein [Muribaculaceae bacterium]
MKKYIYSLMFLLMAAISVGLTSCGDDDEPVSSDIVGTWSYDTDIIGDFAIFFQFTKDGKFHHVHKYIDSEGNSHGSVVFHGKYAVSGTKLTLTYDPNSILSDESETTECDYSVQGDRLMILSGGETITFTRVSDSVIEPYL